MCHIYNLNSVLPFDAMGCDRLFPPLIPLLLPPAVVAAKRFDDDDGFDDDEPKLPKSPNGS